MKRIYKTIGIAALVVLAGAGTWYYFHSKADNSITLDTEKPEYGYIARKVTSTGTIQPVDTVAVGTQVSGTIKFVYADFNSKVKKGQLLAQLDKTLLEAVVNQYKANLAVAMSQLTFEKSTFERQTLLFQTGSISKADLESALYQFNSIKANVQSIQAQLDGAQKNLSNSNIYSPIDGVVMRRSVNIGQTVAASFSTPTFFVIAKDISKMQVRAAVDEADIGNIKQEQRVTFSVDAFPDNTFDGNVEEIRLSPSVSSNVVTYMTIIKAPNDQMKLLPGMTANVIIFTKEDSNALLISAKALKFNPDASFEKQFKIQPLNPDSIANRNSAHRKQRNVNDIAKKMTMDSTDNIVPKRAYVWVKQNDMLIQKRIMTGLNDYTNVQVLKGLEITDEVVTGIKIAEETATTSGAVKSPFAAPSRRGGGGGGSGRGR